MYNFLKFFTYLNLAVAFAIALMDEFWGWGYIPAILGIIGYVGVVYFAPADEQVEETV